MSRSMDMVMADAAAELEANENLRRALRRSDARVADLCREYGDAMRQWGVAPHHLRQAVEARLGRAIAA